MHFSDQNCSLLNCKCITSHCSVPQLLPDPRLHSPAVLLAGGTPLGVEGCSANQGSWDAPLSCFTQRIDHWLMCFTCFPLLVTLDIYSERVGICVDIFSEHVHLFACTDFQPDIMNICIEGYENSMMNQNTPFCTDDSPQEYKIICMLVHKYLQGKIAVMCASDNRM